MWIGLGSVIGGQRASQSEAGVLIEVTSEHEASETRRLHAARGPRATHDHVVAAVVAWRREVVIYVVCALAQAIEVVLAPLPHATEHVVKALAVRLVHIHWLFTLT